MSQGHLRTRFLVAVWLVGAMVPASCDGGGGPSATPTAVPISTSTAVVQPTPTEQRDLHEERTPTLSAIGSGDFEIVSPTTYLLANGELHVAGIIRYTGSTARIQPEVTITSRDAAGETARAGMASDIVTLVKPGTLIPFSYRESAPPSDLSAVEVAVTNAREATELDLDFHYADFETAQTGLELPPAGETNRPVRMEGTVRNTGSKTATGVSVSVIFYSADGKVADVVKTGADTGTLAPGESSTFEAESLIATLSPQPVSRTEGIAFSRVDF